MVPRGISERLFVDGAGLCLPGLWVPWKRKPVGRVGVAIREILEEALEEAGVTAAGVVRKLARGKLTEDPFGTEACRSAKSKLLGLFEAQLESWRPAGKPQEQSIDMRLLSIILHELGDPDAEVFKRYEVGVRLGVGVVMP